MRTQSIQASSKRKEDSLFDVSVKKFQVMLVQCQEDESRRKQLEHRELIQKQKNERSKEIIGITSILNDNLMSNIIEMEEIET